MYAAHIYGSNDGFDAGSWNTEVPSSLLSGYPVFVGEYGPDGSTVESVQSADASNFDSPFFTWMTNTQGIVGATAWSFTINSWPNLYTDTPSNFTPTTVWGNDVKNWLANPPSSGCPPTPTSTYTPCTDGMGHTCTPTVTFTPTFTPTITLSPTPTNTFTITPTPGVVNIVWPNPWPDKNDPNPNQPLKFNYSNSQQENQVALKIYTVAFRKVFEDNGLPTAPGNSTYQVPINNMNLSNGLYFFVIETKGGGSTNWQIMKVLILR
jgi:hypothetical protein